MARYILFDTETTGSNDEDRIIQIGAMVVYSRNNIDTYDELCNCDIPIKLEAMEVHNITPDMIENKPSFDRTKFFSTINELNNEKNYLIAHNLPFDLGMIEKEGFTSKMKHIDTLRCARHLLDNSPHHRLQYLRYSLDLYKQEKEEADKYNIAIKAHDAIGDVLVMKLLLSKLVTLAKEKYPKEENIMDLLVTLTQTPVMVKTFKFGKYKGKEIQKVYEEDSGYLIWMIENMKDLDGDMRYTLEKIMGHQE